MTLGFFALTIAVGASYRLTRLVVDDTIFDTPRDALTKWLLGGGTFRFYLAELIGCRWCVGVWTSFAVTASLAAIGHWPIVPSAVFALAVAGFQCFLNLAEALIAAITEGIEDANTAQRQTVIDELSRPDS